MNAFEKLKELGYSSVSEKFYANVEDWKSWYVGDVRNFHRYKIRTGNDTVSCKRYSLGMAKKVCEDWANMLMNEKVKITLEGQKEQEFIDNVFNKNNFRVKMNEMQELKSALGTTAYVPRIIGSADGKASQIKLDYTTVENVLPISWENGIVTECAFISVVHANDNDYGCLQIHHKDNNGEYVIENHAYEMSNGELGAEVPFKKISGYENVPSVVNTHDTERWFVIDRLNIANNVNYTLPLGVSVFANSIDVLKGVDIAYDSYVNEFVLGKKRIMVKPTAAEFQDGQPVFDTDDVLFYVLPEDLSDGAIIQPVDMSLRTAEHNTGIQDQLNMLSSKCGFGETYYRFNGGSVATATQVISENSTLFRTLKKHEVILESVLTELCRVLLRIGNSTMSAGLNEDVEISIDFDDSIIEDKQSDFNRDMQLLSSGILNDYEFRMKWLNEDEKTAKAALPGMEDMTKSEEVQDEVE